MFIDGYKSELSVKKLCNSVTYDRRVNENGKENRNENGNAQFRLKLDGSIRLWINKKRFF